MTNRFIYIFILLISFSLVQISSCSKGALCVDDDCDGDIDVRFTSCLNSNDFFSKDTSLSNGLELGFFINEIAKSYDDSPYVVRKILENRRYININNSIIGDPISLNKDKLYRIFGYSPYRSDFNLRSGIVQFDHNTDIYWAETYFPFENGTNVINEMPLVFNHLTSQVKFIIEDNRDEASKGRYPIENLNIKVNGFSRYLYLDVDNGVIIPGEIDSTVIIDQTEIPYCIASTYQSEFSELKIDISIANDNNFVDDVQLFTKNIFYNFLPNHSYILKILINTYSINFSSSINDWDYRDADDLIIMKNKLYNE